jgi:hypothetical protein
MKTQQYRIWSFEHDGWWMPRSNGYSEEFDKAGIYESEEAHSIVIRANRYCVPGEPNEALVPVLV